MSLVAAEKTKTKIERAVTRPHGWLNASLSVAPNKYCFNELKSRAIPVLAKRVIIYSTSV